MVALVAVVLIAAEGCPAVTIGVVMVVVVVAATAMAVVTGQIEIMVVEEAAIGTIMAETVVAVAMVLAVVVVGIAVTMIEEVTSPQGTFHELCQCSSSRVSISLDHFNDHHHHLRRIL